MTLANAIAEYARDLRRNSSGGDDYPWEIMRGVADYLDELLKRETRLNMTEALCGMEIDSVMRLFENADDSAMVKFPLGAVRQLARCYSELNRIAKFDVMMKALEKIAAMDAKGIRADDLGRAARIAREAIAYCEPI